jgi:single-strand DNA-binding protein
MNNVSIVGRIGKVSELRHTQGGKPVLNFSVATDNGKDGDGEKRKPTWFEITLWEKQAENLAQYLQKGGLVGVTGNIALKVDEGNDGEKYPKLVINFPRVELLGGNKNNAEREPGDESEEAGF